MSKKLTPQQKEQVTNFIAFTGGDCSETRAQQYLERYRWNLEIAVDEYYNNPPPPEPGQKIDVGAIDGYFNSYRGQGEDSNVIGQNDLMRFFQDLGLSPDDILTLAFSWKCQCKNIGEITKDEFLGGMKGMKITTKAEVKAYLPKLKGELNTERTFKEFYAWLFDYMKGDNPQKKVIELDFAIALWEMTLKDKFVLYDTWIKFLKEEHKKPISRDTWQLLFEFSKINIDKYDSSEAWPVLIDEFVDYVRSQK